MGKFKIGIKFDKKFLNSLTQVDNSGVEIQNAKHHLALHPIHLNDFNKSVKDLLNEGIAKYNKNLNGILLGYGNIKLLSNMGTIVNDSPYIHYDLQVDFFVFKPEIGKEMQGIVNRNSKDHVGILVYNAFNVSLPKPHHKEDWLGSSVNMGNEVLFRITYIDLSSYLPYIKGELLSIISKDDTEISNKKSKPLKNKKIVFDIEEDVEEEPLPKKIKLDLEDEEIIKHKKSKKKKEKRKEKENNEMSFEELKNESYRFSNDESELKSDEKKKHKKKKKRESV